MKFSRKNLEHFSHDFFEAVSNEQLNLSKFPSTSIEDNSMGFETSTRGLFTAQVTGKCLMNIERQRA